MKVAGTWDPVAAAAEKAAAKARKRQWHWCRRGNGFSDQPRWRAIAAKLDLPLYQVVALANRLEEFANDAGNKGYTRGEVGHFDADEFGAALGMPAEAAARIFAALEANGWVTDGLVADFWDRNKDEEDDTAALRQRRKRARAAVMKALADLARRGLVTRELRTEFERRLPAISTMPDAELFALAGEVQRAMSTGSAVTRDSHRDSVTVTAEERTNCSTPAVDNSGAASRGDAPGQPVEAGQVFDDAMSTEAELWLGTEAVRIVVERMDVPRPKAETLLARWRRDLDDDPVSIATIVRACDEQKLTGGRFHVVVADHIRRCASARLHGLPLPLPPVRAFGTDPLSPPAPRHAVTPDAVDKPAPAGDSPDQPSGLARDGTNG